MRNRLIFTLIIILLSACSSHSGSTSSSAGSSNTGSNLASTPLPTIIAVDPAQQDINPMQEPAGIVVPTATPYPPSGRFEIGQSWEDRPLEVWQAGSGIHPIILIGGIHTGYEANTVALAESLISYFSSNPLAVLPNIHLYIIPVANPDGLARGETFEGRFNAHGIDLNRNWGCEWDDTAYLRDAEVDPGTRLFSEPETLALRTFFLATSPDAVLFYHSAASGVFLGACGEDEPAHWLGELLAEATGYPYAEFDYYKVTGDATNWLAERDIPAAVIELTTHEDPEFERNLRGVMALQCHYAHLDLEADRDPLLATAIDRWCE